MSGFIQFDTSDMVVGGVNIAEAGRGEEKLIFNESYTLAGEKLEAPSVYACYDLTVAGDVDVEEIEVSGNLYVVGSIKAKRVSCLKTIVCGGGIDAETIIGSEIIAGSIKCRTLSCSGNVIARTTIDAAESATVEKSVMTGEGIVGGGSFSAKSAAAAEYFEFEGEVKGRVLELETGAVFGGSQESDNSGEMTFDGLLSRLRENAAGELAKAGEAGEEQLLDTIKRLSAVDADMLSDWEMLTAKLIELSYADKITNLRDYLYVVMAKKVLPEAVVAYETIEHVFDHLLAGAEDQVDTLEFHAENVEDLAYSLKIAGVCENELRLDKEELLDRIFQSVGIKYKTVSAFLG